MIRYIIYVYTSRIERNCQEFVHIYVSYGEVYKERDARFGAGLESSFSSFGETSLVVLTHRCQMLNGGEAAEGA